MMLPPFPEVAAVDDGCCPGNLLVAAVNADATVVDDAAEDGGDDDDANVVDASTAAEAMTRGALSHTPKKTREFFLLPLSLSPPLGMLCFFAYLDKEVLISNAL
jgi:RsiW-degrading membrane proteinase PrsW (M82 family)